MHGAAFALVVNIAVAGLFAASFAVLALANPGYRRVLGFSASYAIGMLTPISEFLLPLSNWPEPFMLTSYFSFFVGLLGMAAALACFYRRPPPWVAIATMLAGAVATRWFIWGGARNTLPYELAYQMPFAIASALSAWVVLRAGRRGALDLMLAGMFGLIALHFLVKPFLAAFFGSGRTALEYIDSFYALLSQASTGILLTAAGLVILLNTVQSIIVQSQIASETDVLSGLANRRGFDNHAARALAGSQRFGLPISVIVFDLDHFKTINDNHGHAVGDQVIRSFGDLLRRAAPQAAIAGRLGGEEFAVLLERTTPEGARLNAEAIRLALAQFDNENLPMVTVSVGIAGIQPSETLAEAMRRADLALYTAKQQGRDRICIADFEPDGESILAISRI